MEQWNRKRHSLLCGVLIFSFKVVSLDAQRPAPPHKNIDNFTTCHEFLNGSQFDANKIVGIDWKIFYFWNYEDENSYNIRFQIASPSLVKRFRVELEQDMRTSVNWTNAELFMETGIDFSALYVKTNVSGLYQIIPTLAFQINNELPIMMFALKLVEPEGYLGIMNCKYRLCYALAPVENVPTPEKIPDAAAKLGFHSTFGRSYHEHVTPRPQPITLTEPPPVYENEDVDVPNVDALENRLMI